MNAHNLLRNAEHCLDQASACADDMQRVRFIRAAKAWRSLARAKSVIDDALVPSDEDAIADARQAAS